MIYNPFLNLYLRNVSINVSRLTIQGRSLVNMHTRTRTILFPITKDETLIETGRGSVQTPTLLFFTQIPLV